MKGFDPELQQYLIRAGMLGVGAVGAAVAGVPMLALTGAAVGASYLIDRYRNRDKGYKKGNEAVVAPRYIPALPAPPLPSSSSDIFSSSSSSSSSSSMSRYRHDDDDDELPSGEDPMNYVRRIVLGKGLGEDYKLYKKYSKANVDQGRYFDKYKYRGVRELKFHTRSVLNMAFDNDPGDGGVFGLNYLSVGSGRNQRIGSRVSMRGLSIKGYIKSNVSQIETESCVLVVVYDNANNGGLTYKSGVFNGGGVSVTRNPNYLSRYKILLFRRYSVSGYGKGEGENVGIDEYINLGGRMTYYNGLNTGTYQDIVSGALWVMFYGQSPYGVGVNPIINVEFSLRYYDR